MRAYRSAWLTVCAASGVIGVALAVFVCPPSVFVLMGLAALGIATLVLKASPPPDGRVAHHIGRAVAVSAPALIGACGLIGGFAELGWLWLFCLAIAGAPVWLHQRFGSPPPPPPTAVRPQAEPGVPTPRPAEPEVVAGDTAAICWTWRRSYVALQQAHQVDDRLRIVLLRQRCLDELSARDPNGFRAWLSAGARAASDPSRYVCRQRRNDQGKANH